MTAAVVYLFASLLFLGGVITLALGARMWSSAVAEQWRAHSHGVEARVNADLLTDSERALREARDNLSSEGVEEEYDRPTDVDLLRSIIAQRKANNGNGTVRVPRGAEVVEEFTTEGNEGIEPTPPIPEGGIYRAPSN